MNGTFRERVTPLITSAMKRACFSLSMTQGPAMRKRLPEPTRTPSIWNERLKTFHRRACRDRREKLDILLRRSDLRTLLIDANKVASAPSERMAPDIFNQVNANAFSAISAYSAVKSFTSPPSPAGETFRAPRYFYLSRASAHARKRRR